MIILEARKKLSRARLVMMAEDVNECMPELFEWLNDNNIKPSMVRAAAFDPHTREKLADVKVLDANRIEINPIS